MRTNLKFWQKENFKVHLRYIKIFLGVGLSIYFFLTLEILSALIFVTFTVLTINERK